MSALNPSVDFISPDVVADFYRQDGFQVFQSKSCWWYNQYRRASYIVQFPFHRLITPDARELEEVFKHFPHALAVRFVSPRDAAGYPSAMWVRRPPFTLQDLKPKVRNHTKYGLKHCKIEQMTFDRLVPLARQAHDDTTKRHGQEISLGLGLETNLDACPGYEAWGAFVQGLLVAYMVTLTVEDCVHILVGRSRDQFLKYYPNNALTATIFQEKFCHTNITAVNYGWESVVETEPLRHFKRSVGFAQEPIKQRIVIHPLLRPLVNPLNARILEIVSKHSTSGSVRKLNGMLRIASMREYSLSD